MRLQRRGFSLLEMLTAMVIVAGVMLVIVRAMGRVQDMWVRTNARVKESQDGRAALEVLSLRVPRATLNPYWSDAELNGNPGLLVESDLHFVCGPASELINGNTAVGHAVFFQAPLGYHVQNSNTPTTASSQSAEEEYPHLVQALNAWGYFVEFGPDPTQVPSFLGPAQAPTSRRFRFRLMEFRQPTLELSLFKMDSSVPPATLMAKATDQTTLYQWFRQPLSESESLTNRRCAVVAENVLAVIFSPREGELTQGNSSSVTGPTRIAPDYHFDSRRHQWEASNTVAELTRHRLPPVIRAAVIVLDEEEWNRRGDAGASSLGQELRGVMGRYFTTASRFDSDMEQLIGELNRRKVRFKVLPFDIAFPAGRPAS